MHEAANAKSLMC